VEYQIRIYDIEEGRMDDFVAAWREGVVPLRRRLGFEVVCSWVSENADQFVWIVSYSGPDTFEEASERYYSSDERSRMDPDPSQWVTSGQTFLARRVEAPGPTG
jgi:hypothetical protein